ncbi:hypothetical protein GN244_ATG20755 [Phytophthora infestans]|uniref:RxLR effector protein n=1 Tax=Phytophthora infestans TaxID=4787 RepID=A0A833SD14_PHYIN|nr:hypothetical protein GN244_ATG20755 [Phytophthora infestans]
MRSHMWIKLAALLMLLAATGATSSNSPARALSVEYNVNEKKYLRGDSSKMAQEEFDGNDEERNFSKNNFANRLYKTWQSKLNEQKVISQGRRIE